LANLGGVCQCVFRMCFPEEMAAGAAHCCDRPRLARFARSPKKALEINGAYMPG